MTVDMMVRADDHLENENDENENDTLFQNKPYKIIYQYIGKKNI